MSLLQIYQWVCQWKNFENRLTFVEVMGKSLVSCFFWDTVYNKITPNLLFEYQCTSGKFIRLPNRIETFFCLNWNALSPIISYRVVKNLTKHYGHWPIFADVMWKYSRIRNFLNQRVHAYKVAYGNTFNVLMDHGWRLYYKIKNESRGGLISSSD